MNDAVILGALFLVLLGAACFYFYSRILFTERKIGLIESLLLDIKMNMEMEAEHRGDAHGFPQGGMPVTEKPVMVSSEPLEAPVESEELDSKFYSSVIDAAATPSVPVIAMEPMPEESSDAVVSEADSEPPKTGVPEYETMSRAQLTSQAERRGLRVTKRMANSAIAALLREWDKNSSAGNQAGNGAEAPSPTSVYTSFEGGSGGAPLGSTPLEEVPMDA